MLDAPAVLGAGATECRAHGKELNQRVERGAAARTHTRRTGALPFQASNNFAMVPERSALAEPAVYRIAIS